MLRNVKVARNTLTQQIKNKFIVICAGIVILALGMVGLVVGIG